ncbi:MAG TPA: alpha/beta hydrolase [Firmicutes bacterium]|nr:alpha/beta hydrolase [Bacillota bacterium]
MAINKVMRQALKALSYPDLDTKHTYKLQRAAINLTHAHVLRPFYKIWDHKVDAGDHQIPVRIFSPEVKGDFPVLLFFHGGGWVTGNIDSYDKVCTNMARITKHRVVSVDYRLAPEYPFPAGLHDCYRVAKEIYKNPSLLGIKTNEITLIGDSAGGNLAAAVSLMARDRGDFLPHRQILIYPATYNDHSETSPFPSVHENGEGYLLTSKKVCDYLDLYQGKDEDRLNPYFAPLLSKHLDHQPDTLIITAEYDPLRDEGEAYGKKLMQFGTHVKMYRMHDALHGFMSLSPRFSHVKKAYRYINRFLSEEREE